MGFRGSRVRIPASRPNQSVETAADVSLPVTRSTRPALRSLLLPYRLGLFVGVTAIGALATARCSSVDGQPSPTSAADVCGAQVRDSDPNVKPPILVHRVEPIVNP